MKPDEFRDWRKRQGLKQKDAAELLGLKKRVIQYYEKGKRDGKPVDIPKTVELACYAISLGVHAFDGSEIDQPEKADVTQIRTDPEEILQDRENSKAIAAE
jgi:transcriptional regulator with XRE-family HTH domain